MDGYLLDHSPWTSVEDPETPGSLSFAVYPNPVDQSRVVRLPEVMTVSVVDITGRRVMEREQTNVLDVGLFPRESMSYGHRTGGLHRS
ncbi:MAG: T9SS type A sorting domain-containing protein [Saprospiraceae bacterium]